MPDCFCGGTDPPSLAQPVGIFLRVAATPRIDIGWKFADASATAFFSPVLQFALLFFGPARVWLAGPEEAPHH